MAVTYARTTFSPGTSTYATNNTPYISTWTSLDNGATSNSSGLTLPSNITSSSTVNIVVRTTLTTGGSQNGGYLRYNGSGTAKTKFYLCDSAGNNAVLIEEISATDSITSRNSPKTVNLTPLAGKRVYIKNVLTTTSPSLQIFGDCRIHVTYDTYTDCTAPSTVTVQRTTRSTCKITWSGAQSGTNNTITGYTLIRNTSASTSGATTISTSATSGMTNNPGTGTFYYGVYSKAPYNTAGPKWSSGITITKPSVSAGTPITKAQMDTLKTWINGSQNTVTQYNTATAADGNTYRSGLTAGKTAFDDAWYNAAANG